MDRDRNSERVREREEVYERIPWETLEKPPRDNNRLVMAVAGAVVLGVLAFTVTRNQPSAPVVQSPPVATVPEMVTPPSLAVPTVPAPTLRTEADLYAVEPNQLAARVAAHAEWFALEYLSFDGPEAGGEVLAGLIPAGVPRPQGPSGTVVMVEWVRAMAVSQTSDFGFEVEVLARTLASQAGGGFTRHAPLALHLDIGIGSDGEPRVVRPPRVEPTVTVVPHQVSLVELPPALALEVEQVVGPVVGGEQLGDGRWRVVVMVVGADGVSRPQTVIVP